MNTEHKETGSNFADEARSFYAKNKTMVIIAVALLIMGIGYTIIQALNTSNQDAAAEPTPTTVVAGAQDTSTSTTSTETASAAATSDVPQLSPGNNPQAPTANGDWEPTARAFAEAWANPEGGRDAWLARLRPLVDDTTYQGFERTNFDAYITAQQLDRVQLDASDGPDVMVAIYYTNDTSTPAAKILLTPSGENLTYQVTGVY